ncbi:PEPxxWA-CTERM sorting domain-containing protein [Sphingomonas sp.]|uniref:PEPxxWA-CTERM sorting domain-containing protein n=1 Tax=Sphingomonas sp. TaxID=28214 RepID=UPI0028A82354|nr:PEPxxWA-CTERM sorting domain-containing protein [Sphingomonas sp.]
MTVHGFKAVAVAIAVMASGPASAATLYTQTFDVSGSAFASQNDSQGVGNYATVFDNFTLFGSSTVTGLSFVGRYFNPATPSPISQFTVKFYSNNAGQVGPTLSTFSIPGDGNESCNASAICTYTLALNFAATGGTPYWMSIVPDAARSSQWGWATAQGGDGASFQNFVGIVRPQSYDMAFTLTGDSAVPEPATWAMMLGGFALMGSAVRRRARLARAIG